MFGAETRRTSMTQVVGFTIALFFAVMATRIPTFWIVSTHIDEGVFALVAREIVDGNLPYSTVFEHKPVALYCPAALFMALLGTKPEVMHLTSAVLVLMTCLALFHYARERGLSRDVWQTSRTSFESAGYVMVSEVEGYKLLQPRTKKSTVGTEH